MSAAERRPIVEVSSASIRDAMEALQHNSTNLVVAVSKDMRVLGVVSDGDVRRALLSGLSIDDPVLEIVRRDPVVVTDQESRAAVIDLMQACGIPAIPIVGPDGTYRGLHLLRQLLGKVPRPNAAVLMAGGRGSRLLPADSLIPKPMVKVAGRPILERIINHLVGYGISDILISTGFRAEVIERYFGDGENHGCRIRYVREDPSAGRGTAGSLSEVRSLLTSDQLPLVVMNGDLVTQVNIADLLDHHIRSKKILTVAAHFYRHQVPFGVLKGDGNGGLIKIVEKPTHEELVSAGIYVVEQTVLEQVPAVGAFQMTDLVERCLILGYPVGYWHSHEDWIDVGRPSDLATARGLDG